MASTALASVSALGSGSGSSNAVAKGANNRVAKLKEEHENKMARIREFGRRAKANMAASVAEVVDIAIIDALAFIAALAEGYFGRDKLTVMKVPAHAGVGVLLTVYGLYDAFNGGKNARYFLAAGTGLTAPAIVGLGSDMGRAWAERRPAGGGSQQRTVTQTQPQAPSGGSSQRRVVNRG
jgi:hypothetical protein